MSKRSRRRKLADLLNLFASFVDPLAGGIGQPLSLLLKLNKDVTDLRLYDIRGAPGVGADLGHIDTPATVRLVSSRVERMRALRLTSGRSSTILLSRSKDSPRRTSRVPSPVLRSLSSPLVFPESPE